MPRTDLSWRTRRPAEGYYTSAVETLDAQPVRTFLPAGYEPNYPYPLLVFLHGRGGNEETVLRLAPRLSRRNFISIALRGPHFVGNRPSGRACYCWGADDSGNSSIEDYIFHAVAKTRREYHVHSERIFLAGVCEGATTAYRLALSYPEKVAGVIALNGSLPARGPLFRLPAVRGLKVLIGHGIANAIVPLSMARRDRKLLYTAGLDVRMHTYATTHKLHPDMLKDANRWVMEQITAEEW